MNTPNELRRNGVSLFLGAGASMDMGFPSGEELKANIAEALKAPSDSTLHTVLGSVFPPKHIAAFVALLRAQEHEMKSIDAILMKHRDFRCIGRAAVWWTILEYEGRCDRSKLESHWFYDFLCRYSAGCPQEWHRWNQDEIHGLQIHTLNYDRLAETVLQHWLDRNIPNRVGGLDGVIHHKHGSLHGGNIGALPFGALCPEDGREVIQLSKHLQFWFEKSSDPSTWGQTNVPIQLRGTLGILGFGYHEDIVARFEVHTARESNLQRIVATAHGMPDVSHVDECTISPNRSRSLASRRQVETWLGNKFRASNPKTKIVLLEANQDCSAAVERLFND